MVCDMAARLAPGEPLRLRANGAYLYGAPAAGKLTGIHLLGWGVDYPDVTDFLDFRYWPAFNLADSAISIGICLLLSLTAWITAVRSSGSRTSVLPNSASTTRTFGTSAIATRTRFTTT